MFRVNTRNVLDHIEKGTQEWWKAWNSLQNTSCVSCAVSYQRNLLFSIYYNFFCCFFSYGVILSSPKKRAKNSFFEHFLDANIFRFARATIVVAVSNIDMVNNGHYAYSILVRIGYLVVNWMVFFLVDWNPCCVRKMAQIVMIIIFVEFASFLFLLLNDFVLYFFGFWLKSDH